MGARCAGPGQPGSPLGRRHVDVDEVGAALTRPRPGPPAAAWARPIVDVAVQFGPHALGVPPDGGHVMTAGGKLVGHLADVALDARELVGDHHVDDGQARLRTGHHSSDSTRHGPCR